jgi:rhomboid protease GluP
VHGSPEPGFFIPSLAHLFFNMYALYLVGPIVERWYGPVRFLLFYVLCAAGGSIASFVFGSEAASVGASGAIFGLFGLLLASNRIHRPVDRQSRMLVQQLGFLILINILFGFAIPNIDNAAHIGGLLTGLWIGALWPPTNIETTSSLWQRDRAEATRLASVALVVPIIVVGVVALAVVLGIAVGSPRFLA